ncbi:MAG TPA: CapA family protein [Chloroflexia bacterium]|nr:CapA family protein [Chloroflexia bacterium]
MRHIATALILYAIIAPALSHGVPPSTPPDDGAEAHLIFVGDLMLGRYVGTSVRNYGYDAPFAKITPLLSSADLAIGNLEGPLVPAGQFNIPRPAPRELNLTGDARSAPALARAGFDLLSLANNHSYDSGPAGLRATVKVLRDAGLAPFGEDSGSGQQPVVREVRGLKIAFLGYTTLLNRPGSGVSYINPDKPADLKRLSREVVTARSSAGADLVIVMMHWGAEYTVQPVRGQQRIAEVASQAGADLVVGAHPHVAQGMAVKTYSGRETLVAWSLGNALFDQEARLETRQGLALDCIVDRKGIKSARLIPLETKRTSKGYVMHVADDASGQPALKRASLSTAPELQAKAIWSASQGQPGLVIFYHRKEAPGRQSSTDNIGMSSLSQITLNDGTLTIKDTSSGQPMWSTEPTWRVTSYTVGDANADGHADLIDTLWKRRLTWHRPDAGGMDVDMEGGSVLPHIYINTWRDGDMQPLWHGSPRPAPVLAVAVAPIGKDGKPFLAVLESSNAEKEQTPGQIRLWEWTGGFGYELVAPIEGAYSQMWSDGKALIFK